MRTSKFERRIMKMKLVKERKVGQKMEEVKEGKEEIIRRHTAMAPWLRGMKLQRDALMR